MKKLLVAALCIFSLTAFTDHHEEGDDKNAKFEDVKAKMVTHIDERIAKMNEHKSCVSAAADKEALKACREKMKEYREDMKEKWQEKKKEWKDKKAKKK